MKHSINNALPVATRDPVAPRCRPRLGIAWLFIPLALTLAAAGQADAGGDAVTSAFVQTAASMGDPSEGGLQDREVVSLILGLAAIPLLVLNWSKLMQIHGSRWWIAALLTREVAWTATVLEGFFWTHALCLTEHIFLALSSALLAIGAWRIFRGKTKGGTSRT